MKRGGGSCTICSDIQRLPKECVAHVISLTSPRDACRLEAVSAAFRSAASSDQVWRRFLPSDCAEMVARAVDPVEDRSKKHLYFRLCDPILIDGGRMGFFVDRETGVKCFILPARELKIVWGGGDTPQYWRWIHHPESRFSQVDIEGKINSRMLSKWSNYSAYLVFKVSNTASGFRFPFQVSVTIGAYFSMRLMEDLREPLNDQAVEAPNVPDNRGIPQRRQDGWMEILLGEFYNQEGDKGNVTMSISEFKCGSPKSGLIVQGIEIRPKK